MAPRDIETPALQALAGSDVAFELIVIDPPADVEESAQRQCIEVGSLLRTIVVRRAADDFVFVLVPGGRQISWPKLRSHLGISRISLPDAGLARDATGYDRGAITPFGSTTAWPVIADATVAALGRIAIGGGADGVNLHMDADELIRATDASVADVTEPARPK